jgi:hypothetical protein
MAKLPPCKDCKERHTACHDYCWKYAEWAVDDVIKPKEALHEDTMWCVYHYDREDKRRQMRKKK